MKRVRRKMLGEVPDGVPVMWQNRPALISLTGLGRKVQKWDQLDANLKSFAHMAPVERAVFELREVFDTPYDEIAKAVGNSATAVRQIAHRARDHGAARRARTPISTTEQRSSTLSHTPPA